mmetsp:Transcript_50078/g.116887  ORF Transcript_50078/g.116887 Transcript_50078/m.116887 type:complete len:232 (-) Transcript_50078:2-697(-)
MVWLMVHGLQHKRKPTCTRSGTGCLQLGSRAWFNSIAGPLRAQGFEMVGPVNLHIGTGSLLLLRTPRNDGPRITAVQELNRVCAIRMSGRHSSHHCGSRVLVRVLMEVGTEALIYVGEGLLQLLVCRQLIAGRERQRLQKTGCRIQRCSVAAMTIEDEARGHGPLAAHGVGILMAHPPALHLGHGTAEVGGPMPLNADKFHRGGERTAHGGGLAPTASWLSSASDLNPLPW